MLRDLCLSESKRDGFYHVIEQDSPPCMDRQRRVVIPRNTSEKKVLDELRSMSLVRSVISEYATVPWCENLRLVRVLHAYKPAFIRYRVSGAFKYVNLRHLAVRVDSIASSFFSSITLHRNLHALIVSCYRDSTAPVEIWKMPQFRHIEFVFERLFLPDPPSDIVVVMENLKILTEVENFKISKEAVERIPNIKKLALRYSWFLGIPHDDYYCLSNIQRLHKLESLRVTILRDYMWPNPLDKLTFPLSLKKLVLKMTQDFEWDDIMEKIGSLLLLEKLELSYGGGFRTGEWEIAQGQFPRLKYLAMFSCSNLRKLTIKDMDRGMRRISGETCERDSRGTNGITRGCSVL